MYQIDIINIILIICYRAYLKYIILNINIFNVYCVKMYHYDFKLFINIRLYLFFISCLIKVLLK